MKMKNCKTTAKYMSVFVTRYTERKGPKPGSFWGRSQVQRMTSKATAIKREISPVPNGKCWISGNDFRNKYFQV